MAAWPQGGKWTGTPPPPWERCGRRRGGRWHFTGSGLSLQPGPAVHGSCSGHRVQKPAPSEPARAGCEDRQRARGSLGRGGGCAGASPALSTELEAT